MRSLLLAAVGATLLLPVAARAQATPDDQQWLARMQSLMKDPSPQAARQRATLAYWALTHDAGRCERLRIDPNAVRLQGQKDVLEAARGAPSDPAVWKEVQAWVALGGLAPSTGAATTCPAFEAQPRLTIAGMLCGDFRRQMGDAPGAVSAWRRALDVASDRGAAVALVERIDQTSAAPGRDLAGVSPAIVQEARADEQRAAAQTQQAAGSIAACQSACLSRASQCRANAVVDVNNACTTEETRCDAACAQTNGASAPAPAQPTYAPTYAPGYYPGYYPGYVAPGYGVGVYVSPPPVYVP